MATDHRPNLLFVFADQMRGSAIRCAGNPDVLSPNLDRLAQEGVRFTSCIANYPVCGPSRACLLTSTYAPTNGVYGNDLPIRTDLSSIGTVAKAHGYRTGYIGKWHLDGTRPVSRDEVPPPGVSPAREKFIPPGSRRLGFDDFWAVHNCTHHYSNPRYFRDSPEVITRPGHEPVIQTDLAMEFLDTFGRGDEPFCLVLSWGPPHDPYFDLPQRFQDLYSPDRLTIPDNVIQEVDNVFSRRLESCAKTLAGYYAHVTCLDEQFGRLLRQLDDLCISDSTLVIFTSDHGDMLWSHGMFNKQSPYNESLCVPLLARLPGTLNAGTECPALIGLIDLLPTLCGMLGWELPPTVEGHDLSAIWRGESGATELQDVFIANYLCEDQARLTGLPAWRGLRCPRYTYVEKPDTGPWLLLDHRADPYEQNNLVDMDSMVTIQANLARRLHLWLENLRDPMLPPEPFLEAVGMAQAWRQREANMNWRKT